MRVATRTEKPKGRIQQRMTSVTRFGVIFANLEIIYLSLAIFEGFFWIWQNFELTLAKTNMLLGRYSLV